jgi:hypothetical protein
MGMWSEKINLNEYSLSQEIIFLIFQFAHALNFSKKQSYSCHCWLLWCECERKILSERDGKIEGINILHNFDFLFHAFIDTNNSLSMACYLLYRTNEIKIIERLGWL